MQGEARNRIKRGRVVDGIDGHREGACDDIIAGRAVIDRDGESSRTENVRGRLEGQDAGGIGTGVTDHGSGDEARAAGHSSDSQGLDLITGAGCDPGEIERLHPGILIQG